MNWDLIPLRDVLQISKVYTPALDDMVYQYAALRPYPNGLTLKGRKRGADFRGKRHPMICAGQFVISRTHIQQRYWGLVQPALHEALVHRSTLCFDLHPDLNKNYFAAYLATTLFSKDVSSACTKRGRLDVRRFARINLPFPSGEDQALIAETWQYAHKALKNTQDMYQSIADMKAGIANDLFTNARTYQGLKPLGEYVTIGHDVSVNYPIYVTGKGKLMAKLPALDDAIGIMPNSELDPQFLQYYLATQKQKWNRPLGNTLSSLETMLRMLQIPIPSPYEQRKIVRILQQHDDALNKLRTEQHTLQSLNEGMVQQIFTGTLPLQEAIILFHTL